MYSERVKVVGYARVSTSEQGESGAGLAAQRLAITVEAERRGWQLALIVEDIASGRTMRGRDGLAEALRMIEAGEADGLLVSKLDRLSRSVADFATMLARFQAKGWGLTLLDIGLDTTTVTGAAMAHVVSAFSEMERKRIGERTREALAERRAVGVRLGRPPVLSCEVRERIRRMREGGASLARIADTLSNDGTPTAHGGVRWYPSTVSKVLARA